MTLASQNYNVIEALTGESGLRHAANDRPDLIILDLGLPDMDGIEVTRRIREWSGIPIIVVSARGKEQDKVVALDAGADDYLTKPFGVGELTGAGARRAPPPRDGEAGYGRVGIPERARSGSTSAGARSSCDGGRCTSPPTSSACWPCW